MKRDNVIIKFSEEFNKVKTKLLILSGVSLFVGLTKVLPKKIGILGLDLTNSSHITGWFILVITLYFFAMFLILGGGELVKHYLNDFIKFKSKGVAGNTLGLTEEECIQDDIAHNSNEEDIGTTRSEFRDIQNKKSELSQQYSSKFISISNTIKIISEFIFPIILCLFGSLKLYVFLECAS